MNSSIKILVSVLLITLSQAAFSIEGELRDLQGEWVNLSSFQAQGRWLVFNVWAPRCPPCVDEAPELDAFHIDHHQAEAMVIGLALDYPSFGYAKADEVRRFVDDYFLSFPILMLDADTASELFGEKLKAVPTTYIVSPEGQVVKKLVGGVSQHRLEKLLGELKRESP